MNSTQSIAVIGGGVTGLSIACELLNRGHQVQVWNWSETSHSASWAGAGVLLPLDAERSLHPLDRLCGWSNQLHERWHHDLRVHLQIDNGWRRTGGIYVAHSRGELSALIGQQQVWEEEGVDCEVWSETLATNRFPALDFSAAQRIVALPGEAQLRNPAHLRALRAWIEWRGGSYRELPATPELVRGTQGHPVIRAAGESLEVDHVVVCAGAWSGKLLQTCGIELPTTPVRGQMLLYRTAERLFEPVVNVGNRYLVPREDGFLLAGSTMEEVGFDDGVTAEARRELMELTQRLVPSLRDVAPERQWSGLRPATFDGLPYIGAVPNWPQAWIATGLFRVGLQAAPAVAHIIASLIDQETPPIDIQPFRPGRLSLK